MCMRRVGLGGSVNPPESVLFFATVVASAVCSKGCTPLRCWYGPFAAAWTIDSKGMPRTALTNAQRTPSLFHRGAFPTLVGNAILRERALTQFRPPSCVIAT